MTRTQATIVALVLLLGGGLLHGVSTERWRPSAALAEAVARVEGVPLAIGDWQGRPEAGDAEEFDMAGARGYWARVYEQRGSKARVLAVLMCGRAGRMAVHTPEVCYRGAGYDMPDDAVTQAVPGGAFWTTTFVKAGGPAGGLRLYWAWNAGGAWEAPDNPRWRFRGAPYLYKLYVAHDLSGGRDAGPGADAGAEFLRAFVPALERVLFPAAAARDLDLPDGSGPQADAAR